MHNIIPLILAGLVALSIFVIGCFYLLSPDRMVGSFGLKLPASDPDTPAWLRLKGNRAIASGVVVIAMMLTADRRTLSVVQLALAIIPLGDMSVVLVTGGWKSKALLVHGLTCAVMLVTGYFLIHAN